jgi:hypothetical protein
MSQPTARLLSGFYPTGARVLTPPRGAFDCPIVAVRGDVVVNSSPLGWHTCIATSAYVPIGGLTPGASDDSFHWVADPGPSWSGGGAGAPNPYGGSLF